MLRLAGRIGQSVDVGLRNLPLMSTSALFSVDVLLKFCHSLELNFVKIVCVILPDNMASVDRKC